MEYMAVIYIELEVTNSTLKGFNKWLQLVTCAHYAMNLKDWPTREAISHGLSQACHHGDNVQLLQVQRV